MFWTDTHAHIYSKEFDPDRSEVLDRAREGGVSRIYMPNVDSSSVDAMLQVEQKYPDQCTAMIGLHPCSVKADFEKELQVVEEWLGKRKFAALGEIGIDLYWDKTYWPQQQEAFLQQVQWAKDYELPVVIHSRESLQQTIELLKPMTGVSGIFHCFTGNVQQAKEIIEMGFYIGIGGVATFKNGGMDRVLPHLSLDHIVLETDCPYLAPVPHRGKRNEPSYLPLVASRVAELMDVTPGTLQEITTRNALQLMGKSNKSHEL